jgi:5-methylcytosine-specific restriction protein A
MRHRLSTLGVRVATLDTRMVKPQPKQADPHYLSPQHRAWRQTVCDRAGWRCEWIDERRQRCAKTAPQHRMFADHKKERRDAPDAEFDPANGWCLCGAHHSLKTAQEREKRFLKG